MVVRLKITLEQEEYSALAHLALESLRAIPEQARFIIRKELEQRGLLVQDTQLTQFNQDTQEQPQVETARDE